jgi:16S rRNA (adenine1518-N6/adenine1519-N6)-dimethyltransferase
LPYGIANSLICHLLEKFELFEEFVFLVQKEVAQRWIATPQKYKKEYSALSVYINLIAKSELILKVPKQCFFPAPLVDGSLVRLKIEKTPSIEKEKLGNLLAFLKNCFRHRRKTL